MHQNKVAILLVLYEMSLQVVLLWWDQQEVMGGWTVSNKEKRFHKTKRNLPPLDPSWRFHPLYPRILPKIFLSTLPTFPQAYSHLHMILASLAPTTSWHMRTWALSPLAPASAKQSRLTLNHTPISSKTCGRQLWGPYLITTLPHY